MNKKGKQNIVGFSDDHVYYLTIILSWLNFMIYIIAAFAYLTYGVNDLVIILPAIIICITFVVALTLPGFSIYSKERSDKLRQIVIFTPCFLVISLTAFILFFLQ